MTPPMPPGLVRRPQAPSSSALARWKRTEPVRLYAYTVLVAVVLVLAAVYGYTEDLSAALTGLAAAVLGVVPAAEAARASVFSPAAEAARREADAQRWSELVRLGVAQ